MSSRDDLDFDLDFSRTIRDFIAGQRLFDRYKLNEILGRGGMGVVWRAFDEQLERDVALKFLPEMVAFDEQSVADLKRETKKTQELRHDHIVQVYDFVSDKRTACISMECVDGPTLSAIKARKEGGCLDVNEIKNWVEQLCEALAYAHHRARVVHRDLKPANLMINSKGELKVTDFGIARSVNDSVSMLTQGRGTSGTLVYMSPQQLGGKRASHLDDIYSVGASIYEMLTSKPPFYTGDVSDQIKNVTPGSMQQRRRDLELAGASIPKEWEEAVSACLAKDPNHRPQTAGEIAKRLGLAVPWYQTPNVVDGVRAKTAKVAGGERSLGKPKHRSKLIIAAVIMALLLVASAFAWFSVLRTEERRVLFRRAETQVTPQAVQQEEQEQKAKQDERRRKLAEQQRESERKNEAGAEAEILVADAESLVKSGKLDQAETLARNALSKVPDFVDAKKVIADVAQARKSAAGAEAEKQRIATEQKAKEEAKQQAESQARKDAEKLVADAQSLVKSGELDQAESLARNALSKVPDFVDAKKVIADVAQARKSAVDAEAEKQPIATEQKAKEEAKQEAESQARKDAEKLVTDAQSLVKSGELDQAESLARSGQPNPVVGQNSQPPMAKPMTLNIASITKEQPYVNSLSMKFVPVPITGGPTSGQPVLFSIWDTCVSDYEEFVKKTNRPWTKPSFRQTPSDPAVNVSWQDSLDFCAWLTDVEQRTGRLSTNQRYRLPTDAEWTVAAGNTKYPWGNQWPPPRGCGNYSPSLHVDDYQFTSPVGSFPPNASGLYDMGGNVWQWCEDWYRKEMNSKAALDHDPGLGKDADGKTLRVVRGGSYYVGSEIYLESAIRVGGGSSNGRNANNGFRCTLSESDQPASATESKQKLTPVIVTKYGVSLLLPTDVFPDAKLLNDPNVTSLNGVSWSGRTTLTFSKVRGPLKKVYADWVSGHQVDYKVLRADWFAVSGDRGTVGGVLTGFYVKGVKKGDDVITMNLQYEDDDFPFYDDEAFNSIVRSFKSN